MLCEVDQLCSRLKTDIEGSSVRDLFEEKSGNDFRLLLVDAKNALNSVSRTAALCNAWVLWLHCYKFLLNTYQGCSTLLEQGYSDYILSKKGFSKVIRSLC